MCLASDVASGSGRLTHDGTAALPSASVTSGVYPIASEAVARGFPIPGSARARACISRLLKDGTTKNERRGLQDAGVTHFKVLPLEPLLRPPVPVLAIRQTGDAALAPFEGHGSARFYVDRSAFVVGGVL